MGVIKTGWGLNTGLPLRYPDAVQSPGVREGEPGKSARPAVEFVPALHFHIRALLGAGHRAVETPARWSCSGEPKRYVGACMVMSGICGKSWQQWASWCCARETPTAGGWGRRIEPHSARKRGCHVGHSAAHRGLGQVTYLADCWVTPIAGGGTGLGAEVMGESMQIYMVRSADSGAGRGLQWFWVRRSGAPYGSCRYHRVRAFISLSNGQGLGEK